MGAVPDARHAGYAARARERWRAGRRTRAAIAGAGRCRGDGGWPGRHRRLVAQPGGARGSGVRMTCRLPQHGQTSGGSGGAATADGCGGCVGGRTLALLGRRRGEEAAAEGEPGGALAVGEQAEVADAVEARRQDVEQEPAHELAGVEGHDLLATLAAVVLPAEADLVVGHGDEPAVGDGDAMGVAPEIGEDLLGPAEGALGVDHPVDPPQQGAMGGEGVGLRPAARGRRRSAACLSRRPGRGARGTVAGTADRAP